MGQYRILYGRCATLLIVPKNVRRIIVSVTTNSLGSVPNVYVCFYDSQMEGPLSVLFVFDFAWHLISLDHRYTPRSVPDT